jgi:hypothetical protein
MPKYSRKEMDEMVERWLAANQKVEHERDWKTHLGPMYTDDAEYTWNIGPDEEFVAHGRQQIEQWALDVHMEGFEGWQFPYDSVLVDDEKGEVVGFWRQVAPVKRADGTPYEVAGLGGSWFRYAGDYKWSWQRDFFDFGNVLALLGELAADGHLSPALKEKMHRVFRGQPLAGHVKLRNGGGGLRRKITGKVALAKIAILGR